MKLNWEIRILTKLRYSCLYIVTSSVRCVLGESRSTTPQAGYQKGPGTDNPGIDHTQRPRTASSPICEIPKKTKIGARHKHTNTQTHQTQDESNDRSIGTRKNERHRHRNRTRDRHQHRHDTERTDTNTDTDKTYDVLGDAWRDMSGRLV
jgi:hypothetical protein